MKKLTIEQKAKAYDKVVGKILLFMAHGVDPLITRADVQDFFPELKESEGEKTKRLLHTIAYKIGQHLRDIFTEEEYQCFDTWSYAWLEKQGEKEKFIKKELECIKGYREKAIKRLEELEKQGEQKPAEWNIFDYRTWQYIVADVLTKKEGIGQYLDDGSCKNIAKYMQEEWSKKLSTEQSLLGWSEEDKMMLQYAIEHFERQKRNSIENGGRRKVMQEFIDWLKSLRPQKQDVMSEDEFRHIVGYLVQDIVANEHMAETEKQPTKFFVEKYYKKLRPQSTWKPSLAQMNALSIVSKGNAPDDMEAIVSLYNDLKKLKE